MGTVLFVVCVVLVVGGALYWQLRTNLSARQGEWVARAEGVGYSVRVAGRIARGGWPSGDRRIVASVLDGKLTLRLYTDPSHEIDLVVASEEAPEFRLVEGGAGSLAARVTRRLAGPTLEERRLGVMLNFRNSLEASQFVDQLRRNGFVVS